MSAPHASVHPSRDTRSGTLPALTGALLLCALAATFAPARAAAQAFGGSVVVVDGMVVAGEAAHERLPGSVRAYAFDGEWSQAWVLHGPESAVRDGFGRALAHADGFLFVGAAGGGQVHVYEVAALGGADARPVQTLTAPELDGFGGSLAASGGGILAGATDQDEVRVLAAVEMGDDGRWMRGATVSVPREGGTMGTTWFDVSGDLLAASDAGAGRVQVFRRSDDGSWAPDGAVTAPESGSAFGFGVAVALAGDELLVGQLQGEVVHRYGVADGAWSHAGVIEPSDSGDGTGFGWSLGVDGSTLFVGSAETAYAYRKADGSWTATGTASLLADGDASGPVSPGMPLAFGDGVVALGNPSADFGLGFVTVLTEAGDAWESSGRLMVDHQPLPEVRGGEVACDEGEAGGYDCDHVDLLSFVPREELGAGRGARLNDVWGWTDPDSGREFALVGRMDGTAFVEVTDAANPRYLGNLAKTEGSRANTWRDIKVYKDHAFVVADGAGQHGMQIFDLTQLLDVTEPQEFEATVMYDEIASSHNVAINEETGFAYLVGSSDGGETCGGGSHMVDIRDPRNPTFAGCFAHANTGRRNTGNSHDTQCVIYHGPDEDYAGREICVNSNETAVSIADVTDKDNPVAVAAADYPNIAYAHQGWLTEDHRYYYSNDELDEVSGLVEATRTLIWDLEDLDDPVLLSEYTNPTRATDHNMYVHGDRLYMSNNRAGLRVLDITDPENPTELGFFDTTPWSADEAGFDGTWSVYPYFESGTVLLSSRREGLFVVRPRARRLIP